MDVSSQPKVDEEHSNPIMEGDALDPAIDDLITGPKKSEEDYKSNSCTIKKSPEGSRYVPNYILTQSS